MRITAQKQAPHSGEIPIETLAGNKHLSEQEKVAEASRQFEAVLLRQVLAQAQKTHFHSKLQPAATSTTIYQDMVTANLADAISKSGAVGLASTLMADVQTCGGRARHAAKAAANTPLAGETGTRIEAAAGARSPRFLHAVVPKGGYHPQTH